MYDGSNYQVVGDILVAAKDIVPEKPISEEKKKIINNQMNLFDLPQ